MEKQKISLFTAILMNINVMVGAGAFVMPSLMAKKSGSLSFLGWTGVGLIFIPLVFSMATISNLFPGQNSFYNYSEKGINKSAGFISGWLYSLGYSSMAATIIIALKDIFAKQIQIPIIPNNMIIFSAVFIAFFCYLNLLSLSTISKIQNFSTIFKLVPIIFVIFVMFFYYNPNITFPFNQITTIKYALPLALFGFWGFESSSNISHLIRGDKKNGFLSVMIGFCAAVIIYTLFNFGLLQIMGTTNLIIYKSPAFPEFLLIKSEVILNLLKAIISAAIITSYASCVFGIILSISSNIESMAKENLFPYSYIIKKTNKHFRPTLCVWILGATIFFLVNVVGNKEILTAICNIGTIIAFILTMISMLKIQINQKNYIQTIPTILSFGSCYILFYYSWLMIGETLMLKIFRLLPLIILALGGFIMFKINENQK
ncbi:amino acid permease [Candidatus Dependentiae bacterium]|nr:amino acid permease [Candidatus Dependentiae bacterium]